MDGIFSGQLHPHMSSQDDSGAAASGRHMGIVLTSTSHQNWGGFNPAPRLSPRCAALTLNTASRASRTLSIPFSSANSMTRSIHASAFAILGGFILLFWLNRQRDGSTAEPSEESGCASSSLRCRSTINRTAVARVTRIASMLSSVLTSGLASGRAYPLTFSRLIGSLRPDSSPVRTIKSLCLCSSSSKEINPPGSSTISGASSLRTIMIARHSGSNLHL